jgi:hypothetical protein
MAAENQSENGYQITKAHLSKAIAADKKCQVEEIVIEDISKTDGCNKGENFTCVLFAVEIKATIKGQSETLNYMVNCMPLNEFRAKFLTDVSSVQLWKCLPPNTNYVITGQLKGFERECFVYDHLVKKYQELRAAMGLKELSLPKVYLTNLEEGIIVMENLKTQGYTMMNRIGGEG